MLAMLETLFFGNPVVEQLSVSSLDAFNALKS
jgi:hypothetical protein